MGLKSKVKGIVKKAIGWQPADTTPPTQTAVLDPAPVAAPVPTLPQPIHLDRKAIADLYLKGSGIEVGALHSPLQVPDGVEVKYVDRMTVSELRQQYPELAELPLVEIDIIDDGEKLTRIPDESQDFVIANHFIEHCQNPILSIEMMLRVLKPEGVLYLGVPDKRFTFDAKRPVTDIAHLLKDYDEGPAWSREQHFFEYSQIVEFGYSRGIENPDDEEVEKFSQHLQEIDYSIHYHVWTQAEIMELFTTLTKQLHFPFNVELVVNRQYEIIAVLRKTA